MLNKGNDVGLEGRPRRCLRQQRVGYSGAGRTTIWINEKDLETEQEALQRNCPKLVEWVNYEIKSVPTPVYNCLAWALGIDWASYNPEPRVAGYQWFPGVDRKWTLETILEILAKHNYREETDQSFEPGFEKIAIYDDVQGVPQHFARQLQSGKWTSKVGRLNDIEHYDLKCLEGYDAYGPVSRILKRKVFDERKSRS